MACLQKLTKAITFGCMGGSVGITELLLLNKVDITSVTIDENTNAVTAISLASGAKAYAVDCFKNGVKMIDAIRTTDMAAGIDQTVNVTVYDKGSDGAKIVQGLLNGKFVAFGKLKDGGNIKVSGIKSGLEASAIDSDTSTNGGFYSVAIKTPEGGVGDGMYVANTAVWDYLNNNKQS